MEHIKELSNKMTTMLNNYMNNLKNLMSNMNEPVKRDESVKKIEKMTGEMHHFINGVERFCVMEHMSLPELNKQIEDTRASVNSMARDVDIRNKRLSTIEQELENTNEDLEKKLEQQYRQNQDIDNKKKLLLSRERMLQLSIEKNIYNRKIIYTYVAIICLVLILLFSAYYYYR